uniref:C2 domain-containing protein n=1 Tax=Kalanchoe fedtschenkoi TaxID=63787 RepID=A0A7N0T3T7_KALFE
MLGMLIPPFQAQTHSSLDLGKTLDMDVFLNHSSFSSSSSFNAPSNCRSIQGQILEVTVVAGNRLTNTERFTKQDPYVYVEYGSTKKRTRTCKDGGVNPVFHDKFQFELIEGLHKLTVRVLNRNRFTAHQFIGSGTVYLDEVLAKGCQEYSCNLLREDNRSAGEITLILRYPNAQKTETECIPSPPRPPPFQPQPSFYQAPPPQYHPPPTYPCYERPPPPPQSAYPPPASSWPHFAPPGPFHGSYPPPPSPPPPYY